MRIVRIVLCTALLVLGASVGVDAQVCTGEASFADARYKVRGSGELLANAAVYGAGASLGGEAAFGGVSVGLIDREGSDGSTVVIAGSAGYELPLEAARPLHVCPTASVVLGFGPNDMDLDGVLVDQSTYSAQLGLSLGVPLQVSSGLQIIPGGGLAFAYSHVTLEAGAGRLSLDDSFWIATLGVGFVFSRVLSVLPGVNVPVGIEDADPSFAIALSLAFGR